MSVFALPPINPVLARELKERMRGRRAAIVITIYLLILGGILYIVYQGQSGSGTSFGQPVATQVASVGRSIFEWLVFFMMLLVLFLVPGLTAGAIAGERERQTLVPLQVTLLRPRSIIIGKIAASTAFLALLVVATLPLLSVSYLIGGVTIWQVFKAVLVVLGTGLVLACITVACSTYVRRVQSATVVAYGLTLALALGTFLAYGAAALIDRSRGNDEANPPASILLANPLVAAADVITDGGRSRVSGSSSPFSPLADILQRNGFGGQVVVEDFGGNGVPVPLPAGRFPGQVAQVPRGFDQFGNPVFDEPDGGFPFWAKSFLVLGAVSVLVVVGSSRRLRTPAREER